ncbi:MAG: SUMF1/EgtB/PvdO family nonheme iron enzyme, partial [Verrucomicrobia bacterium]|nr:SUMF1/EgtB/PvdO family nonheme iron enzyme [Verrucomicrobiota bacterium]
MTKQDRNILGISCLVAGTLFTSLNIQAAAPSLSYEISGNELIINYTGTLLQSADAVTWSEVTSASSPYKVALGDKKQFFCAKGEEGPSKNITIPLSEDVELDMIWIEPGTFTMGSPEDELDRRDNEVQHEVTLTQGYWLGKYEVTQAQYKAVTGENPSHFSGGNNPVEMVNWEDAMAFCAKLTTAAKASGKLPEGYEFTLPTEAQWEYACRAGTTTALNSGKNLSNGTVCPEMDEVGWYADKRTYPVGQKQPNAWGLYDMHGNVWEWCLDWYGDYPTSSMTDPWGPGSGKERILRGGCWQNSARYSRSAYRSYGNPGGDGNSRSGFRVALSEESITPALLTITINDSKEYDGTFLISDYTKATATGLLEGDTLTAGAATSISADVGSYSYPDSSVISTPFETAKGIGNYTVTYNIEQSIFEKKISPGENVTVSLPGGVALNLNWIEPGTFLMGSPEGELGAGGDEILHQVTLTSGYWLGKYEITQAQYEAVMGENPSRFKGADLPVENVSWNDAMAFCAKLTEIEQAAG